MSSLSTSITGAKRSIAGTLKGAFPEATAEQYELFELAAALDFNESVANNSEAALALLSIE